jgi:hypothetical protein
LKNSTKKDSVIDCESHEVKCRTSCCSQLAGGILEFSYRSFVSGQLCDLRARAGVSAVDADGNGHYDALTDSLLVAGYLSALSGSALTNDALGHGTSNTSASPIAGLLSAAESALDVDGDGVADVLTDGQPIVHYLFDLRGPAPDPGSSCRGGVAQDRGRYRNL